MARPTKQRCICKLPSCAEFVPADGTRPESAEPVTIGLDEYEVFRLLNLEKKTQSECAARMRVSRSTVARIHANVCGKLALALADGRPILLRGGDITLCTQLRPECANEPHCCHRTSGPKAGERENEK